MDIEIQQTLGDQHFWDFVHAQYGSHLTKAEIDSLQNECHSILKSNSSMAYSLLQEGMRFRQFQRRDEIDRRRRRLERWSFSQIVDRANKFKTLLRI